MDPLNIAMLSIHSSPLGELGKRNNGGMSVYIIELAAELEKLGHRIDIFTLRRRQQQEPTIAMGERTRLVHIDIGTTDRLTKPEIFARLETLYSRIDHFCREEKIVYDLVHSHYWLSGQLGQWLQERWQIPHLVTFHSLGMIKTQVLNVFREPGMRIDVEKRLARSSDCIIVPTRRELENMAAYYDTPRDKMTLIPCGVNLDRFNPIAREDARQRLALPDDADILLYVGRFTSEKGIDRILSAMPLIDSGFQPHLVIIGGDGDSDAATIECRELSIRLGIEDRVSFVGRVPQQKLPMYYSAADLMVFPSLYESFGLVALESLACGTPVVSTPVGALEHVIVQGKTGEVVGSPGPPSLAQGITRVLSRLQRGDITAQAVRASVLNFDWANIANAVEKEYFRLVNDRSKRANRISADGNRP